MTAYRWFVLIAREVRLWTFWRAVRWVAAATDRRMW